MRMKVIRTFWPGGLCSIAAALLLFSCTGELNPINSNPEDKPGAVRVTSISLDRTSLTLKEGESVTLVPAIKPDNASNKAVSWFSSSENVASVDDNGNVTGIKTGNATITAITDDGGKKATCTVTVEKNFSPSITLGTECVSAIGAVLKGKANLGNTVSADLKIGFMYSKSAGVLPSSSTIVDAENIEADYSYSTVITELEPATTYYFRSFVRQNGKDTYGETKEFTTRELSSLLETMDASNIETTSVVLNAKLDLRDINYKNVSYGFCWGTSETAQNTELNGGEINTNAYSASLAGLSQKSQYWYKAYVKLDGKTLYGEVQTFTTKEVVAVMVDLGLSVKWATCNIGASSPEEYGDYYAWGEVEPYYTEGHSQDNPCNNWRIVDGKTLYGYSRVPYKWC